MIDPSVVLVRVKENSVLFARKFLLILGREGSALDPSDYCLATLRPDARDAREAGVHRAIFQANFLNVPDYLARGLITHREAVLPNVPIDLDANVILHVSSSLPSGRVNRSNPSPW